MKRLTISSDNLGLEDICFVNPNDTEEMYNILYLAKQSECGNGTESGILLNISTKLASYEDTGLEPEEVMEYKKFEDNIIQVYHCTLSHVISLLEKEKQGRLAELPCGIGDILYSNTGYRYARAINSPYPCKIVFVGINEQYKLFNVVYKDETMRQFIEDDFGKTVFLTQEEAEQALRTK